MILFIMVTVAISLLSYIYYYEFIICEVGYRFLWAYLFILLLLPFIIYSILRVLTYSDGRKLALLQQRGRTHDEMLADLLSFENEQIVQIEQDLAKRIENIAIDRDLIDSFNAFPDIKKIYEDIVTLYYEYHKNKTPTGIEKDLCDRVYAIETDEVFKRLSEQHPPVAVIYQRLRLLYRHYEEKQKLYDELAKLRDDRSKSSMSTTPVAEGGVVAGSGGASNPEGMDENNRWEGK
jgi:hypothetical protein